jgi:hypothetical protein
MSGFAMASEVNGRRSNIGIWLATAVALIGTAAVLVGAPPFAQDCSDPLLTEGASYSSHHRLWPPGAIECEYATADGPTVSRTDFPGAEWLTLFFLVAGGWLLGTSLEVGASMRPRRFVLALVFAFAAAVVWFQGALEGLLVGVLAFLALAVTLKGARRAPPKPAADPTADPR